MTTLFVVTMVLQIIFGVGFVIAPGALLAPFGVVFDPVSKAFANLYGAGLIGFVVLLWFARKSESPELKMATVYSQFAYMLVGMVILLKIELDGLMNALGWIIIAEHLILLLWFGYFLVKKT